MTPTELRAALDVLHWSQRKLGRILNIAESDARNWARGREDVPDAVARWLANRAAHAMRTPPPDLRGRCPDCGAIETDHCERQVCTWSVVG